MQRRDWEIEALLEEIGVIKLPVDNGHAPVTPPKKKEPDKFRHYNGEF